MSSLDPSPASGQVDFVGSLLVADTRAFVSEWREYVGTAEADPGVVPGDDPLAELRERSKTLQIRAHAAGVGGLAHHLAIGEDCLRRDCDRQRLEECLANILELADELEHEMELRRVSSQAVSPTESAVAEAVPSDRASVSSGVAEPPAGPSSPAPMASPWPGWKRLTASAEASLEAARSDGAEQGAEASSQLLGLTPVLGAGAAAVPGAVAGVPQAGSSVEPVAELVPAEFVVDAEDDDELTDQDLAIPLHLSRRTGPYPLLLLPHEVAIELPPPTVPSFRKRRQASRRVWALGLLAFGVLASLAALALVFTRLGARDTEARADVVTVTRSGALQPQPRSSLSEKGLYVLLAQVHASGESPQLAQLIDDEAASMAKAMTEPCTPESPGCELAEQGRQLLEQQPPEQKPAGSRVTAAVEEWLSGVHRPSIGVLGDARTKQQVESRTQDAVARELFQSLLFQCAAFQDVFRSALKERGLPLDLQAVAMVESGCAPETESPLGALGVWQFTGVRARAYHLRVQPRVIDERLNVAKATAAALDLLSDLHARLGSWQLAFAGYQLGAFDVLVRLHQTGAQPDYQRLASEGRLPPDTLNYVAKVEAVALILANLEHFHFELPPERAASASTALPVPAGTRLGLVARAVRSSTSRLHELNPDLIAELVPGAPGEEFSLQVPRDSAPATRAQLAHLMAQADGAEDCVPLNFDWGRQRVTRAMLSHCKH